jgi:hypothetical protein
MRHLDMSVSGMLGVVRAAGVRCARRGDAPLAPLAALLMPQRARHRTHPPHTTQVWAYEKLASKQWGVIGIQWRNVPCWYKPRAAAKVPSFTQPTPNTVEREPRGWVKAQDRRIGNRVNLGGFTKQAGR